MGAVVNILVPLCLLLLGHYSGRRREKAHYASIKERERQFRLQPALTAKFKDLEDQRQVVSARLVTGSCVVSVDYFKRFIAGFRILVGGEVVSYSSLLDRARREAILRMKAAAPEASQYVNLRLMTSSISSGNQSNSLGTVEVVAFATAIQYEELKPAAFESARTLPV